MRRRIITIVQVMSLGSHQSLVEFPCLCMFASRCQIAWLPFTCLFYYIDDVYSFDILTFSYFKHFTFYCHLYFSSSSFKFVRPASVLASSCNLHTFSSQTILLFVTCPFLPIVRACRKIAKASEMHRFYFKKKLSKGGRRGSGILKARLLLSSVLTLFHHIIINLVSGKC